MVFVISDKSKHGKQDVYMILDVEEDKVSDFKTKKGKTSGKQYVVKIENIYKAQPEI